MWSKKSLNLDQPIERAGPAAASPEAGLCSHAVAEAYRVDGFLCGCHIPMLAMSVSDTIL